MVIHTPAHVYRHTHTHTYIYIYIYIYIYKCIYCITNYCYGNL